MENFRLKVFEAVWNTGSYTKAARQLGLTQPAVSQNIAELEKELGTALFTRAPAAAAETASGDEGSDGGSVRGRKMSPTPAAGVFIQLVRKVLKGYNDISVLFNPEAAECGKVRIQADRSATEYVLPRVLDTLKAVHPNTDFEVFPCKPENIPLAGEPSTVPAATLDPSDARTTDIPAAAHATTLDPTSETAPPDVFITTVPCGQGEGMTLHFEVGGPAAPLVEAVRLLLEDFDRLRL